MKPMRVKNLIFFGDPNCEKNCYHLHKIMEEAFSIIGGLQQAPRPCDPEESFKEYEAECVDGEKEVLRIAQEIVNGLLGKDYKVIEKEKKLPLGGGHDYTSPPDGFHPLDDDCIEDGFGSAWSAWCPECGRKEMVVVRPGKCQCNYCG